MSSPISRRRAPKACHACRDRKIRCDVSKCGIPCRNCSRTNAECSVTYARKRRRAHQDNDQSLPQANVHIFEVDRDKLVPSEAGLNLISPSSDKFVGSGDHVVALPCGGSFVDRSDKPGRRHIAPATFEDELANETGGNPIQHATYTHRRSGMISDQLNTPNSEDAGSFFRLPSYTTPLPSGLDSDLLDFLKQKKCLSLPEQAVRDEFLRMYICYVHPFLPLLDLEHFLRAVELDDGSEKVSLILLQAVLFAASSFVDISYLKAEGFHSRREARKSYLGRVKLLYDSDIESDPLVLIQVLLLMTYWYDKPNDLKGRRYWMRIAWAFANEIGLVRAFDVDGPCSWLDTWKRRLWWCCLMRDRLISFSEAQTKGKIYTEIEMPALSPKDFACTAFRDALQRYCGIEHAAQAEILTTFCAHQAKLCILIGRILGAHYTLSRRSSPSEPEMLPVAEASKGSAAQTLDLDQELRNWGSELCFELHERVDEDPQRNHKLVGVHSALIELIYHTAHGMLHQAQLLASHPADSAKKVVQDFSRETLRVGARRITEIADFLNGANLLRFLPPVGVTALLASALQHTRDAVSFDESIRNPAQKCLRQTLQFLVRLDEIYSAGGHALNFLEFIRIKVSKDDTIYRGKEIGKNSLRYTSLNYATARSQTPRPQAPLANKTWDGAFDLSFGPSSTPQSDNSWAAATTEPTEPVYHRDFQYDELDFEALLDFGGASDKVLPDNFDVAGFDMINWTEFFQV